MDVDKISFFPLWLDVLQDIEQSLFVAIDLELSGVPTKQDRIKGRVGRPSIQERYVEVKQAAEKYHILQFGLTCVSEDTEQGKYVCKPYNFDLSPLLDDHGLGVERDFAFSSSAVQFLHSVQFDFNKPFHNGVQYLTKTELSQAQSHFDARQNQRSAVADMQIKDTDTEALALMASTRKTIDRWLKQPQHSADSWVNIGPAGFDKISDDLNEIRPEFNNYQKRLVHQLVRAEYPQLISTGTKRGFINVERLDSRREARFMAERKVEFEKRLTKQKGFSWVVDAMLGQIDERFDLSLCARHPVTGEAVAVDMQEMQSRFETVSAKLREKPRVAVGHNCFLDFVYIYHTFVGPLPDTVDGFVEALHKQWPLLIDTKYMATHNCGDINPKSSLEEIARELRYQLGDKSLDIIDPDHNKYDDWEHFHEAGFDSLLTAQIAIRLSTKLEKEGAYLQDLEEGLGGVSLSDEPASSKFTTVVRKTKGAVGVTLSTLGLSSGSKAAKEGRISAGMPSFDADFWSVYGNIFRVFGTEEALLSLR